ncbi:DUF305 domain-containing protein [Dactylosporangium vinaceum]|uniref:DUF305 domain-containing protein n=1 Tax=Dactylosporangium vinaceum TaxID=53362 RepID=A0ABV5MMA7_9ACTN|nr:DUF305 domain-containing protein [Dactylosporangium vinaceum]UAB93300.1 DUF305 domain-containing protein [Dactylosporangium vinaceum]
MTQDGDAPINGASVALSAEPEPEEAVTAPSPAAAAPGGELPEKRDIWRRILAVVVVVVAALAVVVLWARPAHEPVAPKAEPPSLTASLSPTDLAFLNLMISLDTSALPLFELLKDDPALAALMGTAMAGHRDELADLRKAMAAGGGQENPAEHAGHDLPGMVLEDDLAAVRNAPADQRLARAVAALREHLTGTTHLATSEGTAGADPAAKAAAAKILEAHGKLLAALPTV